MDYLQLNFGAPMLGSADNPVVIDEAEK